MTFSPFGSVSPNGDVGRFFFAGNVDDDDRILNFYNSLELTGKFETGPIKHAPLLGGDYFRMDSRTTFAGFGANPDFFDTTNIFNPIHRSVPPTIRPSDVTFQDGLQSWYGLYAQDQIELPYHFHALAGVRYDNAEQSSSSSGEFGGGALPKLSEDRISPRGGLLWRPIPELALYGSYTENFGASNGLDADRKPLPPQTAQQWELGAKTELFDGRFSATLAYFDLKKQNLPIQVAPLVTRAVGEAETRGVELDVAGELLPGWRINGAYAYTPFAKTLKDTPDAGTVGKRLQNAPKHSGSFWTTYEFQREALRGMTLGAGVQAVGQREANNGGTIQVPGYVIVDLMASKTWKLGQKTITAQLNVDNLLDKHYFESASFAATFGAPRTFLGSIRVEF